MINLFQYKHIIENFVKFHLISRYKRTVLGYLWTLIHPLMMVSVTAVVFSALFNINLNTFIIFLFSGMMAWNLFNNMVLHICQSFVSNEGIIKKVYFPRILLPFSMSIGILIDSLLASIPFLLIIFLVGGTLSIELIFLLASFLILFIFSLGLGLVVSVYTVYYRDIEHILTIILQALFFLTPILYDKSMLSGFVEQIISYNPLVIFMELFRSPIMLSQLPSLEIIISSLIISFISLIIGLIIFNKNKDKIVYHL